MSCTVQGSSEEGTSPICENTHKIDYFLHDGAPCHTAKSVKKWLEDSGMNVIGPWPGSPPDLNPIKNLWVNMKMKVAEQNPTSFENLKSIVEKVWLETPMEHCKKLARSSPRQIATVLDIKDCIHTKY